MESQNLNTEILQPRNIVTMEELLKRDDSAVGLIAATLLIMSMQIVALMPLIAMPLESLMNANQILLPVNIPYFVAYFTIPLFYYIGVSLLFSPKRIVSPLYVQIGTTSIISMMLAYKVATTISPTVTLIQNLVQTIAFWALLSGEIGVIQLWLARWVIGLSLDSIDRVSFLIEGMSPEQLVAVLGDSFINTYYFGKPSQKEKVWIISRQDRRSKCSMIIAVGEQAGNPNNAIIATVAFQRGTYAIRKTKRASDIRDEIVNNIRGKLANSNPKIAVTPIPIEQLNDEASSVAYIQAQDITVSKLGVMAEKAKIIPPYYKVLIVFTLLAMIGLSFAQLLNYGSYIELIIALIIALGLEIGIPLREELRDQSSKRKVL